MKIYLLFPAFNEEEGLEKILQRSKYVMDYIGKDYELVVVNDGSIDRTLDVLNVFEKKINLKIISLTKNSGITEVFNIGFQYIFDKLDKNDIVISMDSDNTQSPYCIIDMVNKIIKEDFELIIASRFVKYSNIKGVPYYRNFLSNGVAFILGFLFPYKNLKDYSTFYRAYKGSLLIKAFSDRKISYFIQGHGFSSMAEFLLKICYLYNPKLIEVPINLRYDLKEGGSGINIFKTIKGYIKLMFKLHNIKKIENS